MNRKKILLVDDSATTLMMEQMVLRGLPYPIVTARNGREAVAAPSSATGSRGGRSSAEPGGFPAFRQRAFARELAGKVTTTE